jgi:hypothetical protein
MANAQHIERGVGAFGLRPLERGYFIVVDLIFSCLNVDDQELAYIAGFDLGAELLLVPGFTPAHDFLSTIAGMGHD